MQQVEFMHQYNLMRPSDVKKRPEVQVSSGLDQKGGGRRGMEGVGRGAGTGPTFMQQAIFMHQYN